MLCPSTKFGMIQLTHFVLIKRRKQAATNMGGNTTSLLEDDDETLELGELLTPANRSLSRNSEGLFSATDCCLGFMVLRL